MANLIAVADGNLTAAATWATVDSTALISSSSSATALSTADGVSAAFTPGAITIDGCALKLDYVNTGTITATMTLTLYNNTDAAIAGQWTYNANQFEQKGNGQHHGWYFFKFDTTYLLVAGKAYTIKLKLSTTAGQPAMYFCTNGTVANWQHMLRIPGTTAAPAAGDQMHILGELAPPSTWTTRTVTMDSTTNTDYGNDAAETEYWTGFCIGKNGVVTWGTTASTAYILKLSTSLSIYPGGTLNMGTSGTPCPSSSSQLLQFDTGASKGYSLYTYVGSILNMYGSPRTSGKPVWKTLASSTAAAGQKTVNIADDTGWLSGDMVYVGPATIGTSGSDIITLDGNASATALTALVNLGQTHYVDTIWNCRVVLVTRNVQVHAISGGSRVICKGPTNLSWAYFNYTVVDWRITSASLMEYCSIRGNGWSTYGIFFQDYGAPTADYTISNCLFYALPHSIGFKLAYTNTSGVWTVNDIITVGAGTNNAGISVSTAAWRTGCSLTNLESHGFSSTQMQIYPPWSIPDITIDGLWAQCGGQIWILGTADKCVFRHTYKNIRAINTYSGGITLGLNSGIMEFHNCTFENFTAYGNVNAPGWQLHGTYVDCTAINPQLKSFTGAISNQALSVQGDSSRLYNQDIVFEGGVIQDTTAPFVAHANAPIKLYYPINYNILLTWRFRGTYVGGGTIFQLTTGAQVGNSYVSMDKYYNDDTHLKFYLGKGTVTANYSVYRTTVPSQQLTPLSASVKLPTGIRHVPVADGGTAKTISCYVRKDTGYNGNAPRLMLKRNTAVGVTADTVVATATLTNIDTWYSVSGTLPVATDDGVYEVYVDCDGTAGNVFVDDWSIT